MKHLIHTCFQSYRNKFSCRKHIGRHGVNQWRIQGGLVRGPPFGRTAVIFVTVLGLFLAPFRDKIAATSDQLRMRFLAGKCAKMCLRPGLRPGHRWGSLQRSPALPTCLPLTHVALCQRVRGVIARRRYINVLTYLLTYIRCTIGCANVGPDWPLLFKMHEI